jgi:molybdopterin molybdotransferase
MLTFEEARRLVLNNVGHTAIEIVSLQESGGRVLAEQLQAPWDLPPWDTSAMDGFAVQADSCGSGAALSISGYLPAGCTAEGVVLQAGSAMRIMTGAPVPAGCDAVIPLEETEERDSQLFPCQPVLAGQHIRRQGGDIPVGTVALAEGTVLRPQEINLLASYARLHVPVYHRVRVAILSTGDELIEPGQDLGPGKVINSNQYSLACSVREAGGEPVLLGIARDNRESHLQKLAAGLHADMLVTSAGVSAGDRDLVRDCLAALGVRQLFWKIAMKPGGPTAFSVSGTTPVFSLPGNPVSTMVTFEQLVRPAMLKMMGHHGVIRSTRPAVLRDRISKQPGKTHFVRVGLEIEQGVLYASTTGVQHTYNLGTMLRADGLAVIPAEQSSVLPGDSVQVCLLGELMEPCNR